MSVFNLRIAYDADTEEQKRWDVTIESQGQLNRFQRASLHLAMKELEKRIAKREKQTRAFPLSPILGPNGALLRIGASTGYGG